MHPDDSPRRFLALGLFIERADPTNEQLSLLNGDRHLFIRLSSKSSLAVRSAGVSNQKAIASCM
jgi:hypothetical protein